MALRLNLPLCVAHDCRCGTLVDVWGSHAFVCKQASARILRHHAINDLVARAFSSATVPVTKEPSGICLSNSKRPDGLTLVPWKGGKALAWDVPIATTLADSYLEAFSTLAGSASESAAARKIVKYADLPPVYSFQPVALESLGTASVDTTAFISDLGHRIRSVSGDPREVSFLWQRLSVCLQRYNSGVFKSVVC